MGWFVAVDRTNHPCRVPTDTADHRILEFWRCEICDNLFQLQSSCQGRRMKRITNWWTRWRYRKEGYASDQV